MQASLEVSQRGSCVWVSALAKDSQLQKQATKSLANRLASWCPCFPIDDTEVTFLEGLS